jgi:hypothetical protein
MPTLMTGYVINWQISEQQIEVQGMSRYVMSSWILMHGSEVLEEIHHGKLLLVFCAKVIPKPVLYLPCVSKDTLH